MTWFDQDEIQNRATLTTGHGSSRLSILFETQVSFDTIHHLDSLSHHLDLSNKNYPTEQNSSLKPQLKT